jgi:hypothetical protein
VGEPPGSVVCPERRQRYRPLVVCRRHCRVKNEAKRREELRVFYVGFTTIETQWWSCMSLLNSSQNSTHYIQTGGFSPCITIPRFTTPQTIGGFY